MDHLANAIRKCSHNNGKEWVGYLIASEIVALDKAGINVGEWSASRVERAYGCVMVGHPNPSHFYFIPKKPLREMLERAHPSALKRVGIWA